MTRVLAFLTDRLINPTGGMGEQCRNIIENLPDVRFDVISNRRGPDHSGDNYDLYGLHFHRPPIARLDPWMENLIIQAPLLARSMNLPKPDVVHAFDWSSFTAGMYAAKAHQVPLVVTMQLSITQLCNDHVVSDQHPLAEITMATELQGLAKANAIVQVSADYARRWPMFLDKTTVIPNGVKVKEFDQHSPMALGPEFNVTYIGRIDNMKGIRQLLRDGVPPGCRLRFVSGPEGSEAALYRETIQWCKDTERAEFVGPLYGQDKINMLCSSDAVIMPSLHEPFGIVGLEAFASRSLLISSLAGGIGEYAKEGVAIKVDPHEPGSIFNGMIEARDLAPADRAMRLVSGRRVAEDMDWSNIAPMLGILYEQLHQQHASQKELSHAQ